MDSKQVKLAKLLKQQFPYPDDRDWKLGCNRCGKEWDISYRCSMTILRKYYDLTSVIRGVRSLVRCSSCKNA